MKRLGLDIGSTTLKCVALDDNDNILYSTYRRHLSRIPETASAIFAELKERFPNESFAATLSFSDVSARRRCSLPIYVCPSSDAR